MTVTLNTKCFIAESADDAIFEFALTNTSAEAISGFTLCYTTVTRSIASSKMENATHLRRVANFHEIAPPEGLELAPGQTWKFKLIGLTRNAVHRQDGPKSAYLQFADHVLPVVCTDLALANGPDTGELRHIPVGEVDVPLYAVPWPQQVAINDFRNGPAIFSIDSEASVENKLGAAKINELAYRLFPKNAHPFRFAPEPGSVNTAFRQSDTFNGSDYAIEFDNDQVTLSYGNTTGRDYALTVLAQIAHGANSEPTKYKVPQKGRINDSARFEHRGSHLDVSRHFWPKDDIKRFLDMLAWARMNVFQWHLTDDEGWRLEIKALPDLVAIGSKRGPGTKQLAQLGYADEVYEGHYTQDQVREVVKHASDLNITIIPEINVPGHNAAVLNSYPNMIDPDEKENSYFSVQGYPNNALNPAVPGMYDFIETIFKEVVELFPGEYIHIGGDEVDEKAWLESPLAQKLMAEEGLSGTLELQSFFTRKIQIMLRGYGKKIAGWDEVSQGGGVDTDGALMVAWQRPELTKDLIEQGYDVVCSPGQAYYLDMVQASGWQEPGANWAGISSPEHCYTFEADSGLADGQAAALKGVQACIWCEHIINKDIFNHLVFPRLYAIAEAGWTDPQGKNWQRFAAQTPLFPKL